MGSESPKAEELLVSESVVVSKYYVTNGIGVPSCPDPDMIFDDPVHAYTVMRWLNATHVPDPELEWAGYLNFAVFDLSTGRIASIHAMDLESDR